MSFSEWSNNKKKKEEEKKYSSFTEWSNAKHGITEEEKESSLAWREDEIAPTKDTETQGKNGWFQKGAFADGYQFGDVGKTILGTLTDIEENVNTAVVDATENLIDTFAYGVGLKTI